MNTAQRIVLTVGGVAMLGLTVFPAMRTPEGYRRAGLWGSSRFHVYGIDIESTLIPMAGVAAVSGLLSVACKTRK